MREILVFGFLLEIIIFSVFYNSIKKLTCPASIFSILFLGLMAISLCFGDASYDGIYYGYNGFLWIQIAIIFVNLGELLSYLINVKKNRKNVHRKYKIKRNNLKNILLIGGMALVIYGAYNYFNAGGVINTAEYAYNYYTNALPETSLFESMIEEAISIFSLILSFLGGFYLAYKRKFKDLVIAFLPMIYQVINVLYSTHKLGIILTGILMVIGYIVAYLYLGHSIRLKNVFKILKKYWILIPIVFAIFILSFMLRFGEFNEYYFGEAVQKFGIYAFGSPHAFNQWYISDGLQLDTYGLQTFTGIPHAFGLVERNKGMYEVAVRTEFGVTNVYMSFRGLIEDFGNVGALVFLLIFGFLSGYSYKSFFKNKRIMSLFFLVMSYLFIFYSFIISPFIYLNLSVFFIIYLLGRKILIWIFGTKKKAKRKHKKFVVDVA